jgi:hypothetical protein
MTRTTPTTGIAGPIGLRITSGSITRLPKLTNALVTPYYLSAAGTLLPNGKAKATGYNLYLGGVLSEVPAPVQSIAAADVAWAFDTDPVDNKLDAFYLNTGTINLPTITALGVVADNVKITVRDLSNHPDLLKLKGLAAGNWLGSITLSGSTVSLPSVPNLTFSAKPSGSDAFTATYDIASGDVQLDLAQVAYASPQITASLSDSQLKLINSSKTVSFSGSGQLSLPGLGLDKLSGSLDFKAINGALDSLKASITAATPISVLGLVGTLGLDHSFKTGAGTLSVQGGQLLGVGVTGQLAYTPTAISGSLTLNNSASAPLSLSAGGLSLTPTQGTVSLSYDWGNGGAGGRGGLFSFKDAAFNIGLGDKTASFSGDVSLALTPGGTPSLKSATLKLDSDIDLNLGGFNVSLLASDPLAPTKLSLVNSNGALVPTLSGKVAFRDLCDLQLTVPEGGISYGANGWAFNDVQLNLGQNLDLGPVRLGSQASARYQNGTFTLNPDLSVNLDTFALALKPIGQLVNDVVMPITAPIVKVFNTNIDLGSVDSVRTFMDTVKDWSGKLGLTIDLASAWSGLVGYLEDVPGNPYKDSVLTAGELLDFVNYRAFDFVLKNPGTANTAFKAVFNTDLPSWVQNLPQGINYADISMSATVARLDAINKLAAALLDPATPTNQWLPVPFTIELGANSTKPELSGGDAARQALEAQLRQLSGGLQKLDQLSQNQAPVAVREAKTLPLKFGYGFGVPLFDDTINTVLKLINNKPFDVVRSDFSLSSGAELNFALPLAELAAAYPPAYAVLEAINAKVDLRTGLGAQLALSLGLTSSAPSLLAIGKDISSNLAQTPAALLKLFAGRDPVTGSALGLYVGQTPGTPMLQLSPYVQAGLGAGIGAFGLGVDVLAYGRADGTINVNLTNADGSNRAYLSDVLTGLATLPGIKATASVDGTVGITATGLGTADYKFPILKDATLFNIAPQPQALLAAVPEPWNIESGFHPLNTNTTGIG